LAVTTLAPLWQRNDDAERQALGAALHGADISDLEPADFEHADHRVVFAAIREAVAAGEPTTPISVKARLSVSPRERLDLALLDLLEGCENPANGAFYVDLVKQAGRRRRLSELLSSSLGRLGDGADLEAISEDLRGFLGDGAAKYGATRDRAMDGAAFVLDAAPDVGGLWGEGQRVLIARGEYALITGPEGSGKTTLLALLTAARLGLWGEVLGLPVEPAQGRVLLVAADRWHQIRRRWAGIVGRDGASERDTLRDRLVVWPGPLPFDLTAEPHRLAQWAKDFGDVSDLHIDSLGALVTGLTKDDVGAGVAQAFNEATAQGLEVIVTYHPRKATAANKRPTTLADVYGSRWIPALAGSVISLWGEPGDPVVQLRHLKPPMIEVGPFRVSIDSSGYMRVTEGSDLMAFMSGAPGPVTVAEVARFLYGGRPNSAQVERARRKLESLDGQVRRVPPGRVTEPVRYVLAAPGGLG
jgi:AAA domain/DnaB-like helicase N terminal domain